MIWYLNIKFVLTLIAWNSTRWALSALIWTDLISDVIEFDENRTAAALSLQPPVILKLALTLGWHWSRLIISTKLSEVTGVSSSPLRWRLIPGSQVDLYTFIFCFWREIHFLFTDSLWDGWKTWPSLDSSKLLRPADLPPGHCGPVTLGLLGVVLYHYEIVLVLFWRQEFSVLMSAPNWVVLSVPLSVRQSVHWARVSPTNTHWWSHHLFIFLSAIQPLVTKVDWKYITSSAMVNSFNDFGDKQMDQSIRIGEYVICNVICKYCTWHPQTWALLTGSRVDFSLLLSFELELLSQSRFGLPAQADGRLVSLFFGFLVANSSNSFGPSC